MLYRIQERLRRSRYNQRCSNVLHTEPLNIVRSGLKILSMLCHVDVIMYLVAVKSFYNNVGEGEIVIIDDGTLTAEDREILSHHLGSPQFITLKSVDTGSCPKGGAWERIFSILHLTSDHYVIQLDSDTLTRHAILEVSACIRSNRSFTLGTQHGTSFQIAADIPDLVRQRDNPHVVVRSELALARLPDAKNRRYVMGSAGFAGFAQGAYSRADAVAFSRQMEDLLGAKWSEWGSEQVTSNYLIANAEGAIVLPYPKYTCFGSQSDIDGAAFLHFIGSNRWDNGVYLRESRAAIELFAGAK